MAKTSIVKRGLSHRHIVLGIGICVALIVVLTLWASRKGLAVSFTTRVTTVLTSAQIPEVKDVVKKATSLSFDDLN